MPGRSSMLLPERLENSQSQEIAVALEEISKIGRLRLESAIS